MQESGNMFESSNVMLTLHPQTNREGRIISPPFNKLQPWQSNQIDFNTFERSVKTGKKQRKRIPLNYSTLTVVKKQKRQFANKTIVNQFSQELHSQNKKIFPLSEEERRIFDKGRKFSHSLKLRKFSQFYETLYPQQNQMKHKEKQGEKQRERSKVKSARQMPLSVKQRIHKDPLKRNRNSSSSNSNRMQDRKSQLQIKNKILQILKNNNNDNIVGIVKQQEQKKNYCPNIIRVWSDSRRQHPNKRDEKEKPKNEGRAILILQ